MFLSIVIATLDRENELENALRSIEGLDFDKVSIEVFVVDQGASECVKKMCIKYNVRYLAVEKIGLSYARNQALVFCKGEYIAFMDDDAELSSKFLKSMISHIERDEGLMALSGRILNLDDRVTPFSRHQTDRCELINLKKFDMVLSSALVLKRSVLDLVGCFDERFGVGARWGASEESDLVLRLIQHGIKIQYYPDIIVYHPRADFTRLPFKIALNKAFKYGNGRGALIRKHNYIGFWHRVALVLYGPLGGMIISAVKMDYREFFRYFASLVGRLVGMIQYDEKSYV